MQALKQIYILGETRSHRQIPCIAEQNEAGTSDSLAIGTGRERPQAALPLDDSSELQHMATHPVWLKPHHQQQSRLADDLMKLTKKR